MEALLQQAPVPVLRSRTLSSTPRTSHALGLTVDRVEAPEAKDVWEAEITVQQASAAYQRTRGVADHTTMRTLRSIVRLAAHLHMRCKVSC